MQFEMERFREPCTCGARHEITVKEIWLESNVLSHLPDLLLESGWRAPVVIADDNTWEVLGRLTASLIGAQSVVLSAANLHADEHGVQAVLEKLPEADVLIAVGAGTIHDITRYVAYQKEIPFVSMPTAASVDGFVSTVAAMTWHGCKKTLPAVAPTYVLVDNDVIAGAPARLTASGVSDLLGKYTALTDWRVAHILTGEPLCARVCALEEEALDNVCVHLDAIRRGEARGCELLMYGLLLSGLAMQMVGTSRPASGSEHHFSHLWEMQILNGALDAYHGEKVGVGMLLTAQAYHNFGEALYCGNLVPQAYQGLDRDLLGAHFSQPGMLEQILEENIPDPLADLSPELVISKKEEILEVLDALPSRETLHAYLVRAGAPHTMEQVGLTDALCADSCVLSPYVRNRLTLMRVTKLFLPNSFSYVEKIR